MANLETTVSLRGPVTLVTNALNTATPTLRDIAKMAGASYGLVRAWRLGTRIPTPDRQRKLAKALRKHARRLVELADRLEPSSKGA